MTDGCSRAETRDLVGAAGVSFPGNSLSQDDEANLRSILRGTRPLGARKACCAWLSVSAVRQGGSEVRVIAAIFGQFVPTERGGEAFPTMFYMPSSLGNDPPMRAGEINVISEHENISRAAFLSGSGEKNKTVGYVGCEPKLDKTMARIRVALLLRYRSGRQKK